MTIEVGKKAPAFSRPGSDGKTHTLKDYEGSKVLIFFYPNDDTPGCTKEACGLRDDYAEIQKHGVEILGVSKNSLESHDKFINKYNLPFTLLADEDLEMLKTYDAYGEKMRYGKTVIGVLRSTVLVDESGEVIKHWKAVKAAEHSSQVLKFLESLN